jgi:hypothetical protein
VLPSAATQTPRLAGLLFSSISDIGSSRQTIPGSARCDHLFSRGRKVVNLKTDPQLPGLAVLLYLALMSAFWHVWTKC